MNCLQKSERSTPYWWKAAVAATAVLMVMGCNDFDGYSDNSRQAEYRLTPAQSCDEVVDHLAEVQTEQALDQLYGDYWGVDFADGNTDDAAASEDGGERSDEPAEYTDTNVQEEGVDEPDIIKTDGTYIYAIADNALQIIKSWPADETELVGRYDLDGNGWPRSLFLKDDTVVVFSHMWHNYTYDEDGNSTSDSFSGTRVSFFDVTDRSDPQPTRHLDIEGSMADARRIDESVYLVTNSHLRLPGTWQIRQEVDDLPERTWDETEEELEVMREQARPLVRAYVEDQLSQLAPADWLPRQRVLDGDETLESFGVVHKCTDLYLPGVAADLGILNISSFELSDDAELESTGLVARGWNVYASQQNLYVAMSSRTWWWGWWGWGDRQNESHIHKFALGGDGEPDYLASGRIDGWILNQFSFSEYDGYLRVATTDNQWEWNPDINESEDMGGNHLIVLKEQDGELVETGSVRDLAPTERVYSARFNGDRGYMVTFFEVDPLYTFDLSDPYDPQMLGELKIEGFSSYMHPLGDDHLLAIGMDGDESGMLTGFHLQIFDVSDMTDPQRTHHHVISTGGWSSWSEAMHNHHAFTYQDRLGVLAVPVNIWDWENDEHFSGLILFDATKDGISEIGRVDHGDLIAQYNCLQAGYDDMSQCNSDDYNYYWWSNIRRSIMMSGHDGEEYVYSFSDMGLKVNETFDTDSELASILLRQ